MDKTLSALENALGQNRIKQNEPMSLHTTFKIGGPAEYYLAVDSLTDLVKAVTLGWQLQIPIFVFGGGSNIIIADHGIKGLVVKNNCRKFDIISRLGKVRNQKIDVDKVLLYAESGVIMNQLVRFTIEEGLEGLEWQLGLPGTVGGAVCMNSNFPLKGAYVGDVVYKAKILTKEGEVKEVDNSYFHFAYDKSILQETGEILLSATFQLVPADKKMLWERATEALEHRNNSQPKGLSAGCTFRNFSVVDAMRIPTPDKITSAGFLIDKAGLKGKRIGDAMISDKHANFIMNMGNAKADDVVQLVGLIKSEVMKRFGVQLTMEVKKIGF